MSGSSRSSAIDPPDVLFLGRTYVRNGCVDWIAACSCRSRRWRSGISRRDGLAAEVASSTPFGLEKKLEQAPTARSSILAFRPRGFPRGSYSLSPTLTFLRPSSPPSPPPYATYDADICTCTESTLAFSFSLQVQSHRGAPSIQLADPRDHLNASLHHQHQHQHLL